MVPWIDSDAAMSKILLIEPDIILRQAIRLYLSMEHDVEVEQGVNLSELRGRSNYDLLIVDAAAFQDQDLLSREISHGLRSSEIPMLWLGDDKTSRPVTREKLIVLNKPIEREPFQTALDDLLDQPPRNGAGGSSIAATVRNNDPPEESQKGSSTRKVQESQVIELVDIVDEQSQ